MLSNEISDEDDLDDLFTVDDLHEQDEEYDDPDGQSTTDRSDFEESTPSTSQVSASLVSSGERLTGSVSPSPPPKRSRRNNRLVASMLHLSQIILRRWTFLQQPERPTQAT